MKKLCFVLLMSLFISKTAFGVEEKTFSMIKPAAFKEHHAGEIIHELEKAGFVIQQMKVVHLTQERAKAFYKEHEGKPFFEDLTLKMSSGPIVALVLQRDNAIKQLRETVGATNPEKAAPGTIRALFGKNVSENAIHASDSPQSSEREIAFFFKDEELINP